MARRQGAQRTVHQGRKSDVGVDIRIDICIRKPFNVRSVILGSGFARCIDVVGAAVADLDVDPACNTLAARSSEAAPDVCKYEIRIGSVSDG